MDRRQSFRDLPHKLSEAEVNTLAREHTDLVDRISELESDAKEDARKRRDAIKTLKEAERKMRGAVKSGFEERQTLCSEEIDFDAKLARLVREDTGEVVEQRQILDEEMVKLRAERAKERQGLLLVLPTPAPATSAVPSSEPPNDTHPDTV